MKDIEDEDKFADISMKFNNIKRMTDKTKIEWNYFLFLLLKSIIFDFVLILLKYLIFYILEIKLKMNLYK